jgi:hypothetical protein
MPLMLLALGFLIAGCVAFGVGTSVFLKIDRWLALVVPAFFGAFVWVLLSTDGSTVESWKIGLPIVIGLYLVARLVPNRKIAVVRVVAGVAFLGFCSHLGVLQLGFWREEQRNADQNRAAAARVNAELVATFENSAPRFVISEIPGWELTKAIPIARNRSDQLGYELFYRSLRPANQVEAFGISAAAVYPKPAWFLPPARCIELPNSYGLVEARCVAHGNRWQLLRREGAETLSDLHVAAYGDLLVVTDDVFPVSAAFLDHIRWSSSSEIKAILKKNDGCLSLNCSS